MAGPTTPCVTWGQPVTLLRPQSTHTFAGCVNLRISELILVWAECTRLCDPEFSFSALWPYFKYV